LGFSGLTTVALQRIAAEALNGRSETGIKSGGR